MSTGYFESGTGKPDRPGHYAQVGQLPWLQVGRGLDFRALLADKLMLSFVEFAPNTEAPVHSHVEQQVVVILEGELEFTLGGEIRLMRKGDVAVIPPWVEHGARTLEQGCRELDIFSPPRANLVDALATQASEASR